MTGLDKKKTILINDNNETFGNSFFRMMRTLNNDVGQELCVFLTEIHFKFNYSNRKIVSMHEMYSE